MAEPLLRVAGLTKSFGGLVANDGIALEIAPAEIHAVIGPNGAGKSTLVALIAGEILPDAGTIALEGRDISRLSASSRALRGLGRSFQLTSILDSFSALENVAIAAQAHDGHSFRFWRAAHRDAGLNRKAEAALALVGLEERRGVPAAVLSHGEHRLLEVAMALAGEPRLLLLDEPTSGIGPQESRRIITLLQSLRSRYGMLLIEHDMDVVFALADRITVLANGRVIASGQPAEIRRNAAVREAYLGDAASPRERSHA